MNAPLHHPLIVARKLPFAGEVKVMPVPDYGQRGATIAEIIAANDFPEWFIAACECRINDQKIQRRFWKTLRIKPNPGRDVVVSFTLPLGNGGGGGGGGGSKSTVATVASIAVLLVAAAVSGGALGIAAGLGTALGVSASVAGAVAGAAIGIGGALAISALIPPPSLNPNQAQNLTGPNNAAASLSGNILAKGDPMPRVIGAFRLSPPFISPPLIEIIGDDTVAEAVYGLAGPHNLSDVFVGTTSAASIDGLAIELHEGLPNSPTLGIVQRQSYTDTTIAVQMAQSIVSQTDGRTLQDQTDPTESIPQWEGMTSRVAPDEVWIHLLFAAGQSRDSSTKIFTPFRLRGRQVGASSWINFPEFHVERLASRPFQVAVKLMWQSASVTRNVPDSTGGLVKAFTLVPTQNLAPYASGGWQSDSYFISSTSSTLINPSGKSQSGTMLDGSSSITPAFDGTTSKSSLTAVGETGSGNLSGYVELNGSAAFPVNSFKMYATTDKGFTESVNKSITISLLGSNDNFVNDSNTLYSGVFTSSASLIISQALSTTAFFRYYRFVITENSGDAGSHSIWLAQAQLYTTLSGDPWLDSSNVGSTTGVINMDVFGDRVEFYLNDPVKFPQSGQWEFQLIRGQSHDSGLTDAGYMIGSTVYDYFGWVDESSVHKTIQDQTHLADTVNIVRVSSIWNETPVPHPDAMAVIGIKVTNRTVDQLTVMAKGYTYDWDGSGWNTLTTTSNPAPHFRDVLTGNLGGLPLPVDIIDDTSIVDWRQRCADNDFECNVVVEGKTYVDVLKLIAQCGYAQPFHNEKWGVIQDKDRSADAPVQVFTPRNMQNFSWTKAFTRQPTGIRASFYDADNNYTQSETVIFSDPENEDSSRLEQISYDGLVHEDVVATRAQFDINQALYRLTFYSGTADVEAIVCQRGDLIAIQNDVIDEAAGFSRIANSGIIRDGFNNVIGLTLDGSIPLTTEPGIFSTSHLFTVDHIVNLGASTGIAIRLKGGNGIITHEIIQGTTAALTAEDGTTALTAEDGTTPLDALVPTDMEDEDVTQVTLVDSFVDPGTGELDDGCLVTVGRLGSEYRRLIVYSINPKADMTADMTFVDEAPQLWGA